MMTMVCISYGIYNLSGSQKYMFRWVSDADTVICIGFLVLMDTLFWTLFIYYMGVTILAEAHKYMCTCFFDEYETISIVVYNT